jgi:hypothetical protein
MNGMPFPGRYCRGRYWSTIWATGRGSFRMGRQAQARYVHAPVGLASHARVGRARGGGRRTLSFVLRWTEKQSLGAVAVPSGRSIGADVDRRGLPSVHLSTHQGLFGSIHRGCSGTPILPLGGALVETGCDAQHSSVVGVAPGDEASSVARAVGRLSGYKHRKGKCPQSRCGRLCMRFGWIRLDGRARRPARNRVAL